MQIVSRHTYEAASPRYVCGGGENGFVPGELIFSDLFAYGSTSLAWLRLFRVDDGQAIALVVEPEDNPGQSAVNNAEGLLDAIEHAFIGLPEITVFVAFSGLPIDTGEEWLEIRRELNEIRFARRSAAFVTGTVGEGHATVDCLPATCASIAGSDHPLLALVDEPEPERDPLDELAVVAVADLPWPHNPSDCRWIDRFRQCEELLGASGSDTPAVGAQWFLSLSEEDFAECPYHRGSWVLIAEEAVALLNERAGGSTRESLLALGAKRLGNDVDRGWLGSLFSHAISWAPGDDSITNGQHRTCALRAAGATHCIADVHGRFVPTLQAGDPRRRAAAEVSAYWARRAAD